MRRDAWRNRKRFLWPLGILAGVLVFLLISVDDWRRDFTTNEAFITADSPDPRLRPLVSRRSLPDMVEAVRRAAGRVRNLQYVGLAADGDTTQVIFIRTSRIWRLKDDIVIRVEDTGGERIITGESRSRVGFADLGVNPRTLRRILAELRDVLEGSN